MIKLEDFDISILPKSTSESADSRHQYPVVITSQAGAASGELNLDVTSEEFQSKLERVRSAEPNRQLRQDFGEALYNALFTGKIRDRWSASVSEAEGLRVRLDIQPPELAILPWELMYQDDVRFLGTANNLVLCRYLRVLERPRQPIEGKVRVLLIAQSPDKLPEILTDEFDQLRAAIQGIGDSVKLTVLENSPFSAVHEELGNHDYHILHFLGHGIGGSIALTDQHGQIAPIKDEQFATLMQGRESVKLVVFNACSSGQHTTTGLFSGVGPALIRNRVPAVIAMQYPAVSLTTAADFSTKFYQSLSQGLTIDLAVNQARNYLAAASKHREGRDWSTPVLYMGTRRGDTLYWSLNGTKTSSPMSTSAADSSSAPPEYAATIQEIQKSVKGLEEWLQLNDKYQRLQLTVASFADSYGTFRPYLAQPDQAIQLVAIEQLERAWLDCSRIIHELEWMPSEFSFIISADEPLPDKRNFVNWISELSTLGNHIRDTIDNGRFDELESATTAFQRKLEQRSRGPLNVVRDEVKHLNDLAIRATAAIATN